MTERPRVEDFATDFDHTDPAWVNDPYPIWEDLRQRCPVAHTDRYGGAWFPATHAGVSTIAKDTDHFTSRSVIMEEGRPGEEALPAPIGTAPPISSDPPFHAMARKIILPAFAPGVVNGLEPQIRELCRGAIERLGDATRFDASWDYARLIPPSVIRQMLGFPEEDTDKFIDIVHMITESVDLSEEERIEQFEPIEAYFVSQIEDHQANPRDDLTSFLLDAEIMGEKLAGRARLWHHGAHPRRRHRHDVGCHRRLALAPREEPERPCTTRERARLDAGSDRGVPSLLRAGDDGSSRQRGHGVPGLPMKEYDWILLGFPAANRDPVVFKDADQFIIDRARIATWPSVSASIAASARTSRASSCAWRSKSSSGATPRSNSPTRVP